MKSCSVYFQGRGEEEDQSRNLVPKKEGIAQYLLVQGEWGWVFGKLVISLSEGGKKRVRTGLLILGRWRGKLLLFKEEERKRAIISEGKRKGRSSVALAISSGGFIASARRNVT